jgi:hypothetical protein
MGCANTTASGHTNRRTEMGWLASGDAACDTCEHVRICVPERERAIQMMRAGGWRHMKGKTLGGQDFETILCPTCAKDERRRRRKQEPTDQEALPLDWEEGRIVVGKQGVQTR